MTKGLVWYDIRVFRRVFTNCTGREQPNVHLCHIMRKWAQNRLACIVRMAYASHMRECCLTNESIETDGGGCACPVLS